MADVFHDLLRLNLLDHCIQVRYRLYGEWEKDDDRNPLVLSARQLAKVSSLILNGDFCNNKVYLCVILYVTIIA
jgi:hypothetical protein